MLHITYSHNIKKKSHIYSQHFIYGHIKFKNERDFTISHIFTFFAIKYFLDTSGVLILN